MRRLLFVTTLTGMALYGQPWSETRQAQIRGGGGDGKCTIEVEVDGVAEVEITKPKGVSAPFRVSRRAGAASNAINPYRQMPISGFAALMGVEIKRS